VATGQKKLRDPSERVARRLLAEGRISRELHDAALRHRSSKGVRFEEALIELGISEEQVLKLLAEMYRVQYISAIKLSAAAVDKRTLALVPAQIAEQRQVVPVLLDRQRSVLSVVTSDPEDLETFKELELATQVRTIRALFARPAAVEAAVRKFYLGDDFAFSLMRNESYDVARALERDPVQALAAQRGEPMLGEREAAQRSAASMAPALEPQQRTQPSFAAPAGHAPPAAQTATAQTARARASQVVISSAPPEAPMAPAVHSVPPQRHPAAPSHPGLGSIPPQSPRTPPSGVAQRQPGLSAPPAGPPAVTVSTEPRRVLLTPPPPPPVSGEAATPDGISPLPMSLEPALATEPPPPPSIPSAPAIPRAAPIMADRPTPLVPAPALDPDVVGDSFQLAVVMVSLLEGNRKDLRGHSIQTARLVATVCEGFELPPARARAAEVAALVHDLGKASSYHLTPYNVASFDGHRAAAQKLYATPTRVMESAKLAKVTLSAVQHMYERYDGQGFPDGLKANDIPIESRILAICDSYTDLTNNPRNSFRRVLTAQEACEALREMQGAVFDPKVIDRFSHVVLGDEIAQRLRSDRGTVLLVDPDVEETTVLELALLEKKYDVHVARAVDEALRFVESADVDIVVSEMTLEPGTGFELLRKVRARSGGTELPFVFLSQETDATKVAEALEAGAADYLFKPLATPVLLAKLRRILEQTQGAKRVRGVSGSLEEMAIPDLVQILHQGRKTGALQLSTDGEQGTVFFKDGTIVDATFRNMTGEAAFYAIVGISTGDFTIDPTVTPPTKVIQASPEMLLLEGMRRMDEASR
jgi:response regulator RpfG family c-di-GMP phosphodiesterase